MRAFLPEGRTVHTTSTSRTRDTATGRRSVMSVVLATDRADRLDRVATRRYAVTHADASASSARSNTLTLPGIR